jgi:hypothetical protein
MPLKAPTAHAMHVCFAIATGAGKPWQRTMHMLTVAHKQIVGLNVDAPKHVLQAK